MNDHFDIHEADLRATYRLNSSFRVQMVVLALLGLGFGTSWLLVELLGLGTMRYPAVFPLVVLILLWASYKFLFLTPIEVLVFKDGMLAFRSLLRTTWLDPADVTGITIGLSSLYVRHEGGTIHLFKYLDDIDGFLTTLQEINPSIPVKQSFFR